MSLLEVTAGFVGLCACLLARRIAAALSQRFSNRSFWAQLASVGRALLSPENDPRFFREYLRLWPALGAFVAKTFAIMALSLAPVVLAFAGLTELDAWRSKPAATSFAASPAQPLIVKVSGQSYALGTESHSIPVIFFQETPTAVTAQHGRLQFVAGSGKRAYASRWAERLLLASLGFSLLECDCNDSQLAVLVIRPDNEDGNLLWPYLSDWEFCFFAAASLAAIAGAIFRTSRA
jgi:hypothetical protein